MGHAAEANELFEIASDELRPIVGDNPGRGLREQLPGPLQDDLDFAFGHRFANLPVHQVAAVAIQHAAEVVEGAREVKVGDIHVPVLVRLCNGC